MKGIRFLVFGLLASFAAAVLLVGCDDSQSQQQLEELQQGTVNIYVKAPATARSITGIGVGSTTPNLIFEQIGLLSNQANGAIDPADWGIPGMAFDLKKPIPILSQPSNLFWPDMNGGIKEIASVELPATLYDSVKVVLDDSCKDWALDSGLPFDEQTLAATLPIIGGMRVEPNETMNLLINMATGDASVF